jgi:hypothetical protein
MSRQNHDPYEHHYLLSWAETNQAQLRGLAAQEHLAQQMSQVKSAGRRAGLAARLRQVSVGLWMALHGKAAPPASVTSGATPAGAAYEFRVSCSGPFLRM